MTTAAPTTPEAAAAGAEEAGSSLWSDAWRRLRKNRVAVAAGVVSGVSLFANSEQRGCTKFGKAGGGLHHGGTPVGGEVKRRDNEAKSEKDW